MILIRGSLRGGLYSSLRTPEALLRSAAPRISYIGPGANPWQTADLLRLCRLFAYKKKSLGGGLYACYIKTIQHIICPPYGGQNRLVRQNQAQKIFFFGVHKRFCLSYPLLERNLRSALVFFWTKNFFTHECLFLI